MSVHARLVDCLHSCWSRKGSKRSDVERRSVAARKRGNVNSSNWRENRKRQKQPR